MFKVFNDFGGLSMTKSILFSVACILSAVALHYSSDYMQYKDVPVTFVDRHLDESCSKSNCRDRFVGLFKTNEGVFFDREIGYYTYSQMHIGEKFTLNLRRFDIKQTPWENAIWFFGVVILFSIGLATLFATLLCKWIEVGELND